MSQDIPHMIARSARIAIVQSDKTITKSLIDPFIGDQIELVALGSALEFYGTLSSGRFSLAVIDENLSDQNGLVLAHVVSTNIRIPVIMLVDNLNIQSRMASYRAGAVACIEKPLNLEELSLLTANILATLPPQKLIKPKTALRPEGGCWELYSTGWVLVRPDGHQVQLTMKEFRFMEQLAGAKNGIAERRNLLVDMQYEPDVQGNKALEAVVHRLRKKTDTEEGSLILTAHGVGWNLSEKVTVR
jgi:two-component system OmpR family response regulator